MAVTLKNLFGSGQLPESLSGELRTVLLQMRQERSAVEGLLKRAEEATAAASQLAAPIAEADRSLQHLTGQVRAVDAAMPRLVDLDARLAELSERFAGLTEAAADLRTAQARADAEIREASGHTRTLGDELAGVRALLDDVASLKTAVAELTETREAIEEMRAEVLRLREQADALHAERAELRRQHDAMRVDRETLTGETRAALATFTTLKADVAETGQRAAELRDLIEPVSDLVKGVPEARQELRTLQALRDYVAQKVALLEEQRGLVDRAADRGERLGMLLQRLDGEIREQSGNLKILGELRGATDALRGQHAQLLEEGRQLRAAHEEVREQDAATRREMGALQVRLTEELERAGSRFAFERDSLEAVSARVAGLRETLTNAERRFQPLEDAAVAVDDLRVDVGHLAERVDETKRTVAEVALQGARVREVEEQIQLLDTAASALAVKLDGIRTPSEGAIMRAELRVGELASQLDELEQRTRRIGGTVDEIRTVGQEIERQRLAVAEAAEQLRQGSDLKTEAGAVADRLGERVATLAATLDGADARLAGLRTALQHLDDRAAALDVPREAMDRFEDRLREWQAMESRLGRVAAQVTERQAVLHVVRDDLRRMFAVAEETADQVRSVAIARGELEAGRAVVERVLPELHEVRAEIEALDARREAVAQDAAQVARLEALLAEARGSLAALESQRDFLEQVVSTAGKLRFQSRQAESLIEALQEAWERARG